MAHEHHHDTSSADHGDAHAHHDHADHATMFRSRFWLSAALTIPVVVLSPMVAGWFGYEVPLGWEWVPPVLGTVIFVYGGSPFLAGAVSEIRARTPGMMLLIGMAITVAFAASLATTLGWFELDFWWELAALITVMLLGHWMEMRAIGQASSALSALAHLLPDQAERVTASGTELVAVSELGEGDEVLVRPGGRIPADGEVVEGSVDVDESMITGESRPQRRVVRDRVVAGTVATDNSVRIRVEAVGEATVLAGIQRLVAEAQESRSRAQALADRAAAWLFYVAVGAAVVTATVWLIVGESSQAVTRTVSVLVIACPHALGLAIPLVIAIATGKAARSGILVKDRLALEEMRRVDVVLFDKTGTLTLGRHRVSGVAAADGDTGRILAVAAAAESESEHPLARAIVAEALRLGPVPTGSGFQARSGRGVEAVVDGVPTAVGGPALLAESGLEVPNGIGRQVEEWRSRGAGVLYVVEGGRVTGAITTEDEIRPESRSAVEELQALGVQVAMITGDAAQVAEAVGADLGIAEVMAEVLPEDKHRRVAELQERGLRVAMVGDGVNDAPALAQAEVGIAIGAGTDVAIESAGLVLASDDPRGVVAARRLSEASHRKMIQNLVWASGYNLLAIPMAAGAFGWAGVILPPAAAAVLMSASTVVVAFNAQLLRRLDLSPD